MVQMTVPFTWRRLMAKKEKSIEVQRELDKKPVTGRFKFLETPGGTLEFPYRKYKGEPLKKWSFVDGQIYTIPRGIASHLQREGKYQVHEHCLDDNGQPSMRIGHWVDRYTFEAISFLDEEDEETPTIYTAETIPDKKKFNKPLAE